MDDVEVGNLIIQLSADLGSFKNDMTNVVKASNETTRAVQENTKKIEESAKGIKEYAKGAVEGLSLIAESRFFKDSLEKFEAYEAGMVRLETSIKQNGQNVEEATEQWIKFAKAQAAVSTSTKGEILGMAAQAESIGLFGNAARKAVKDAIALSAISPGTSAESFLRGTIELNRPKKDQEEDEGGSVAAQMLARQLGIRNVKDEYERLEKIQLKIHAGEETQAKLAHSSAQEMARLSKTFNELRIEAGGTIARGIEPFIGYLKELADVYKGLNPQIKSFVATIGALGGATLIAVTSFKLLTTIGLIPAITKTYSYFFVTSMTTTAITAEAGATVVLTEAQVAQNIALAATTRYHRELLWFYASRLAVIGGVVVGYFALTKAIVDSSKAMKTATKDAEDANKASEEFSKNMTSAITKRFEELNEKPKGEMLEGYEKEVKRLGGALQSAKEVKESIEKDTGAGQFIRRNIGIDIPQDVYNKAIKKGAEEEIKLYEELISEGLKRIADIKGGKHATSQEDKKARDMLKSLKEEENQLIHTGSAYKDMGERGIEMYQALQSEINKILDMQKKHVAPDILNKLIEGIQSNLAVKQKLKLTEEMMDLDKEIQKSIDTFNVFVPLVDTFDDKAKRVGNAIKEWELRNKLSEVYKGGFLDPKQEALLEHIRTLTKAQEEQERLNRIMEFGKSTTKEFELPETKYDNRIKELNDAFKEGAMDFGTYSRAVSKAREELEKLGSTEVGITGVLKGSKEAQLQDYAFQLKLLQMRQKPPLTKEDRGLPPPPNMLPTKTRPLEVLDKGLGINPPIIMDNMPKEVPKNVIQIRELHKDAIRAEGMSWWKLGKAKEAIKGKNEANTDFNVLQELLGDIRSRKKFWLEDSDLVEKYKKQLDELRPPLIPSKPSEYIIPPEGTKPIPFDKEPKGHKNEEKGQKGNIGSEGIQGDIGNRNPIQNQEVNDNNKLLEAIKALTAAIGAKNPIVSPAQITTLIPAKIENR